MDFYGIAMCKRGQKSEHFPSLELYAVYLMLTGKNCKPAQIPSEAKNNF